MNDLDKLREIYLTDVDEETRQENLEQIRSWEEQLQKSEAFQSWKEHPVTAQITQQAHKTYVSLAVQLATDRSLPDLIRTSIYARQDAMLWLISLVEEDHEAIIASINADIKRALEVV